MGRKRAPSPRDWLFDHMLTLLAKHGRFGLVVEAKGDTYVDASPHR